MPRHSDDIELSELMRRLKKLQEKFPAESTKATGTGNDGFDELEATFLRRYENAKQLLAQMSKSSDTLSVQDSIRQRRDCHQELQAIADTVRRLGELAQKERNRKAKGKSSKISDEELVRRENTIATFATFLRELHQDMQRIQGGESAALREAAALFGVSRTTITKAELFEGGKPQGLGGIAARNAGLDSTAAPDAPTGLTGEQEQALQEIYRREDEQDQMLEEIGALVEEMGQIAETINETLKIQGTMLDSLSKHVDKAEDSLISTNSKLKATLEQSGMSWERVMVVTCCMILLLALVGVLVQYVVPIG